MEYIIVTENQMVDLRKLDRVYKTEEERKAEKRRSLARLINKTNGSLHKAPKKKQVADHFYFFSNDIGFSYFGKETIAKEWCNVSVRTVEETMALMKKNDEIIVAYRVNPKSNGLGVPFIILKNHPNFEKIAAILNIECEVECEVEKAEIPTESKVEEPKKVPTYYLTLKSLNNNLTITDTFKGYKAPLVNKSFKQAVQEFLQTTDTEYITQGLWSKAIVAYKKSKLERPLREMVDTVISAFKDVIVLHKQKRINKNIYGYFYSVLLNEFNSLRRKAMTPTNSMFSIFKSEFEAI